MDQGILPFVFEAAPQPMNLTAFAGLTLVSETMLALDLEEVVQGPVGPTAGPFGALPDTVRERRLTPAVTRP